MKLSEHHGSYIVTVSPEEIAEFRSMWPGADLPDDGVVFEFDSLGNLIDIIPSDLDGPAVLALSQDAQALFVMPSLLLQRRA